LRYFALGVKDELEDGEDVREIFKQAADDTQSRRKALEIAGKIKAANLIDAGHDFEEPVNEIELGLSPQTWIHCCGGVARRIAVGAEVPDNTAVGRFDQGVIKRSKKATLRIDEILLIVEWKIHSDCMLMCRSVFGD
jgi:hypothetical protein